MIRQYRVIHFIKKANSTSDNGLNSPLSVGNFILVCTPSGAECTPSGAECTPSGAECTPSGAEGWAWSSRLGFARRTVSAEVKFYIFTAFMALITTAGVPCPGKEVSPITA
jgi:hypothetical protein